MAYGTAAGPDDIERYYTDIRGGRPPTPEHLQELKDRYEAIGNVFPLGETTVAQADGHRRATERRRRRQHVPRVPRHEALAAVHPRGRRAHARRRHGARHRHRDGAALVGDVGRDLRRAGAAGGRGSRRDAAVHVRAQLPRPSGVHRVPDGTRARGARGSARRRARRRRRDLQRALAAGAHARRRLAAVQVLRLRRLVPLPRRPAGDGRSRCGAPRAANTP